MRDVAVFAETLAFLVVLPGFVTLAVLIPLRRLLLRLDRDLQPPTAAGLCLAQRQHDLSVHATGQHPSVRVGRLGQRHGVRHAGAQPARRHLLHELG